MGRFRYLFLLLAAACSGCTALPWQERQAEQPAPRSLTAEVLDWEVERNLAASKLIEAELALASYHGQPVNLAGYQATDRTVERLATAANGHSPQTIGPESYRTAALREHNSTAPQQQRQHALQVARLLTKLVQEDNPAAASPRRDLPSIDSATRGAATTPVTTEQALAAATAAAASASTVPIQGEPTTAAAPAPKPSAKTADLPALVERLESLTRSLQLAQQPTPPAIDAPAAIPLATPDESPGTPDESPDAAELTELRQQLHGLLQRLDRLDESKAARHSQPSSTADSAVYPTTSSTSNGHVQTAPGPQPEEAAHLRQTLAQLASHLERQMQRPGMAHYSETLDPEPQQTIRPDNRANFARLPSVIDR